MDNFLEILDKLENEADHNASTHMGGDDYGAGKEYLEDFYAIQRVRKIYEQQCSHNRSEGT